MFYAKNKRLFVSRNCKKIFNCNTKIADNALNRVKSKIKKIKPIDLGGLFLSSVQSGKVTPARFVEEFCYEDFDPDSGSYCEISRSLLEDLSEIQ